MIRFRLADDWLAIARRAWSIRLILLAAALQGLEVALPYLPAAFDIHPGLFTVLSIGVTVAAAVARLVAQSNLENSK